MQISFKMKEIIFVCVFTSFITALVAVAVQNKTNDSLAISPRIIDGESSVKVNYREVAIVSDADNPPVKLCSGVLIKTEWILTSAYCAQNQKVLRVLLGSSAVDTSSLGTTGFLVDAVFVHPSYNPLYMIHDIALLYVKSAINAASVTLAALPSFPSNVNEYIGQAGIISGYGLQSNDQTLGTYELRYKEVQIINNAYCVNDGHTMNYFKLCTAGRAVCLGDEGGPLTIGNTVVGIASVALRALNCENQISTTYTRVNYYIQWIQQTMYIHCRC